MLHYLMVLHWQYLPLLDYRYGNDCFARNITCFKSLSELRHINIIIIPRPLLHHHHIHSNGVAITIPQTPVNRICCSAGCHSRAAVSKETNISLLYRLASIPCKLWNSCAESYQGRRPDSSHTLVARALALHPHHGTVTYPTLGFTARETQRAEE